LLTYTTLFRSHPRNRLLTHESRVHEFSRLQKMGIKGIKIDFFGGDGQSMIEYYQDIFRDAASFELMVNCHGSTIPRGWQRTYPNLMTMEAVKGFEYLTFEQENANQAATTDRKSTRLNSSHVSISYAVFCLK